MKRIPALSLLCAIILFTSVMACFAADKQENDPWQRIVSLDLKDTNVSKALEALFKGAQINYSITEDLSDVMVSSFVAKDITIRDALNGICRAAGAAYRIENGVVVISIAPPAPGTKQLDINVKDMPLSEVVELIFKDSGKSYTIDPSVQQLKITAALKNVPMDTALKMILKAAGAVYRIENGVYSFTGINAYSPGNSVPTSLVGLPQALSTASGLELITNVLDLKYVNASDIAPIISKDNSINVSTTSGNKLVITGAPYHIAEASKIVQALDVESVLARSIRLRLTAEVTVNTGKGPKKVYEAVTESVGAEQTRSQLNLDVVSSYTTKSSKVTNGKKVSHEAPQLYHPANLFVNITPSINPDGQISLIGSGSVSFPFTPNFNPGSCLTKDFDVVASATEGKPIVIAAGSIVMDVGKLDGQTSPIGAEFIVSITATPEQGRVQVPHSQDSNRQFQGPTSQPNPAVPGISYNKNANYNKSW